MTESVTIDMRPVMDAYDQAEGILDRHVHGAMRTQGIAVSDEARRTHDYDDRTSLLTQSILVAEPMGSFTRGKVTLDITGGGLGGVNYASYIEDGTENEDGSVRIRPRKFLSNAMDVHEGDFATRVETAAGRAFKEAGL